MRARSMHNYPGYVRFRPAHGAWGIRFVVALIVLCTAPWSAYAVAPAVLVDAKLQTQRVQVTNLRNGQLSYFDADGRLRQVDVNELVQVRGIDVPDADATPTATPPATQGALLTLTDGQRLVGQWQGASADGGAIAWTHPLLGKVSVPLERVRGWRSETASTALHKQPAEDRLVLNNGDTLTGFITAATADGVSIQTGDGKEPLTLPGKRIHAVVLANPAQPAQADMQTLVLADGSVLHVKDVQIVGDRLMCRVPLFDDDKVVTLPLGRARRIDFTATGRRLVPLTDCNWQTSDGGEVFGLSMRPRVEEGVLHIHAPASVTFELPAGAQRFAATAELATGPGRRRTCWTGRTWS